MDVAFNSQKNNRNIRERGLSFEDVSKLDWDSAIVWEDVRKDYGEQRFCALVVMTEDNNLYAVVFTIRGQTVWIISFRRANFRERRKYNAWKTQQTDGQRNS